MELKDFKFQLISLILWLASGTKGNIVEEGFTRVKRLMNPRLREVSLAWDYVISEAARSLSHFTLKKLHADFRAKGKVLRVRWILAILLRPCHKRCFCKLHGYLYHVTQPDVCLLVYTMSRPSFAKSVMRGAKESKPRGKTLPGEPQDVSQPFFSRSLFTVLNRVSAWE